MAERATIAAAPPETTPCIASNPQVACATDDKYAMPLAVTMLTAARNLAAGRRINLFLLDGGLSSENRERLSASWRDAPIDVHWLNPDTSSVADLKTSHHISQVAYFRILLPRVLPDSVTRVLYLDSDLLVLDDLQKLWEQPLDRWWCRAVPDIACPCIDARYGLSNYRRAVPYLASLRPIANYAEFQIPPESKYFNSGVLLIDLERWRREALTERMLDCLRENDRHVWCWDQYALNAVLAGNWKELPLRWNFGTHAFEFPSGQHAPLDECEFAAASGAPGIVHFTTEFKPWNYNVDHPYRELFFRFLDETAWAGWRPSRPPFSWKRWWDSRAVAVQKRWIISYRKLSSRWSGPLQAPPRPV